MVIVSVLGANELIKLLSSKLDLQKKGLILFATAVPPLFGMICALFSLDVAIIDFAFVCAVMICFGYEVLCMKTFEKSIHHLVASLFSVLYCGYFMTFISRMTMHDESRIIISVFILMVCMCDSVAWFFGNLFGKNNKGIIKASPNKSIAGFIGGFAGSILVGVVARILFPNVFHGTLAKMVLLGFLNAFVSIIGDLLESVVKRSSAIKDSGTIVPGRGGILDSIDSVVFAAPIYYLLIKVLF